MNQYTWLILTKWCAISPPSGQLFWFSTQKIGLQWVDFEEKASTEGKWVKDLLSCGYGNAHPDSDRFHKRKNILSIFMSTKGGERGPGWELDTCAPNPQKDLDHPFTFRDCLLPLKSLPAYLKMSNLNSLISKMPVSSSISLLSFHNAVCENLQNHHLLKPVSKIIFWVPPEYLKAHLPKE